MRNVFARSLYASLLALVCLAASPAHAQLQFGRMDTSLYLGASVGNAHFRTSCEDVPVSCDDNDIAWKGFAGYRFHRNFAVEAAYVDFGRAEAEGVVGGAAVSADAEVRGFELVGVLSYPIHNEFEVYGKLGAIRSRVEVGITAAVPGFVATEAAKSRSTDLTFGVGLKYRFVPNVAARVEWQRYQEVGDNDTGTDNIDLFTVGLLYSF